MAHLASIEEAILAADAHFAVDVIALNNSGVEGTVLLALDGRTLSVASVVRNLTPDQLHVQHIHGRFDDDGNPIDSLVPTGAEDTDLDGFVEVAEGAAAYGDIILPLEDQSDGFNTDPVATEDGAVNFYREYDLDDDSQFLNPLSGTQYAGDDLLPLTLREFVIHGLQVDSTVGAGTEGSIDGEPGYELTLPVGAGGIEAVTQAQALDILEDLMQEADPAMQTLEGTDGDDLFEGLTDGLTIFGGAGTDTLELEGGVGGFDVATEPTGRVSVEDGDGARTELVSVERIAFDDATLLFDLGEMAEDIYLLYAAGLDRRPDEEGLRFWVDEVEGGRSLRDIAAEFVESDEFEMAYGTGLDDSEFVDVLYGNVLGRGADPGGEAYWEGVLADPGVGRGDALLGFARSPENVAQESENIEDGFLVG